MATEKKDAALEAEVKEVTEAAAEIAETVTEVEESVEEAAAEVKEEDFVDIE